MKILRVWGVREIDQSHPKEPDTQYFINTDTITRIALTSMRKDLKAIVGMVDGSRIVIRDESSIDRLDRFLKSVEKVD